MEFRDLTVEDAKWAVPLLQANGYRSCEFAFANLYIWRKNICTQIARFEDYLIVRYEYGGDHIHYQFPSGTGPLKPAIEAILEDARALGRQPHFSTIPAERVADMEAAFPGYFEFQNPRGASDYVYLASDLAMLPGRKYQKKRNHCSKFERMYPDWEFCEITKEHLDEICKFNDKWCNLYVNQGDEGIEKERYAIQEACRHYDELHLKGGFLRIDGKMVAYSFGSPLGADMFDSHVEKALYDVNGAYAMINREMARYFGADYTYINRENDVDEEGLRDAKLSYHPALMVEKFSAEPRAW